MKLIGRIILIFTVIAIIAGAMYFAVSSFTGSSQLQGQQFQQGPRPKFGDHVPLGEREGGSEGFGIFGIMQDLVIISVIVVGYLWLSKFFKALKVPRTESIE